MFKRINTTYKIRAAIPSQTVELLKLMKKAQEMGINLVQDTSGNLEGVWEASLLTLGATIEGLQEVGLRDFLVERRVVSMIIAIPEVKEDEVMNTLRNHQAERICRSLDVFSENIIIGCIMNCEMANTFVDKIQKAGMPEIIAFESYEVVTERTNAKTLS